MSDSRELKIIIKADGSVAVEEINKLDRSVDRFGADAAKTDTKLNKLTQSILQTGKSSAVAAQAVEKAKTTWNDFATGVNQAWESLGKVKQVFATGWEWAKQGAQLQEARASFDDYARSVGKNSEDILSKLRKASGGTIDDLGLITTASKAMALGVTQDSGKMANLLEIARNKARLFGIDTTQAFDNIVTGIGRGSPLILDNLGIRIPAGFEKMTEGMTDVEKTSKLMELTLEEGNKQLAAMGGISNTTADDLRAMEASLVSLKSEFGSLTTTAFGPFVEELRTGVIPALNETMRSIREISQELGGFSLETAKMYKQQGLAGEYGEKMSLIADAKKKQLELDKLLNQTYEGLTSYDQQRIGQNYAGNRNASLDEIKKAIADRSNAITAEVVQLQKELEATKSKMLVDVSFKSTETDIQAEQDALNILDKLAIEIEEADKKAKKTSGSVKELKADFSSLGTSAIKDLELMGDGFDEFADEMDKVLEDFDDGLKDITKIRQEDFSKYVKAAYETVQKSNVMLWNNTTDMEMLMAGTNWISGGMLTAQSDDSGAKKALKDIKEPLSETIAEAVQAGFANADFSNLSMTLGGILTSVLSKSVAQSNPVMDAGGAINWGNLGANIGVSFATKAITGLFTTKEKNKEAIQQAANIQDKTANAYMDSFETMIGAVYASPEYKNRLKEAQKSFWGAKIGYSWDKDWSWSDLSYVKEYQVNDMGASAAYKKITEAADNMQTASDNYESELNLKSAQGYDYAVLSAKIDAYKQSLQSVTMFRPRTTWNGTEYKSENLTVLTNEVRSELETMIRELGSATADRSNAVASGFAKYAPWLEEIFIKSSGNNMLNSVMPGITGYSANVSSLSRDQYFDAYEGMQTDFADRNISPELLNMVKQSGSGKYELEKLRVTGSDDYAEKYLEYVEKQVSAYEEVLERQEEIFSDAARTFEERSAALATYEAAQESYYQAKLDALAAEQAAEAAIKQKQQEADLRKAEGMEAALSLVGEVAQRGDKIVILQGGDSTAAMKTLLEKFQDDPSAAAILTAAISENEAKARWGN